MFFGIGKGSEGYRRRTVTYDTTMKAEEIPEMKVAIAINVRELETASTKNSRANPNYRI